MVGICIGFLGLYLVIRFFPSCPLRFTALLEYGAEKLTFRQNESRIERENASVKIDIEPASAQNTTTATTNTATITDEEGHAASAPPSSSPPPSYSSE